MGILPERRDRRGAGDPFNTVSDGPVVAALELAGAFAEHHRHLHLSRFRGRRNHFRSQWIKYEVISRTCFEQCREARLCILETVNSFDPNRPTFRKLPEDVVGLVHIPPLRFDANCSEGIKLPSRSAIRPPMGGGQRRGSYSKQVGYYLNLTGGSQPSGRYVNRPGVWYILRNCRQVPGIRPQHGAKVAWPNARRASRSAARPGADCGFAVIG